MSPEYANMISFKLALKRVNELGSEILINEAISSAAFNYVRNQIECLNGPFIIVNQWQVEDKGMNWSEFKNQWESYQAKHRKEAAQ